MYVTIILLFQTEAQPETEEGSSEETTTQVSYSVTFRFEHSLQVLFIDDTTEEDSVNTNNIEEPQEVVSFSRIVEKHRDIYTYRSKKLVTLNYTLDMLTSLKN